MRLGLAAVVAAAACGSTATAPTASTPPHPGAGSAATQQQEPQPPQPPAPPPPDTALVHTPSGSPRTHLPRATPPGAIPVVQLGHFTDPGAMAFDRTAALLASADGSRVIVWDVATREVRARFRSMVAGPHSLAFSPDDTHLAIAGFHDVRVLDLARGTASEPIACDINAVPGYVSLAYSADATSLVVVCRGTTRVFDAAGTAERYALTGEIGLFQELSPEAALSPDGKLLAFGRDTTHVELRAVADGARVVTIESTTGDVAQAAWRPDGRALALSSEHGATIYDAATGKPVSSLPGKTASGVAFDPTGSQLAVATTDGVVAWTPATDARTPVTGLGGLFIGWPAADRIVVGELALRGPPWERFESFPCQGGCGDLATAWSHDGALAAQRQDHDVRVWDVATKVEHPPFPKGTSHLGVDRTGSVAVLRGYPNTTTIDLRTGKLGTLPEPRDELSPDGKRALHQAGGTTWSIIDVATGRAVATADLGVDSNQSKLGWSGDGTIVWALHDERVGETLKTWRANGLAATHSLHLDGETIATVTPLPGGSFAVVNMAHALVDLAAGTSQHIDPAPGDDPRFPDVATSPSGDRFTFGRRVYQRSKTGYGKLGDAPGQVVALSPASGGAAQVLAYDGRLRFQLVTFADGAQTATAIAGRFSDAPHATFYDDGKRVVISTLERDWLWDLAGNAEIADLGQGIDAGQPLGARCLERDDDGVRIVRIDTGDTLDIDDIDGTPAGIVAVRSDGAVQGGATGLAHTRIRPGVAPTGAPATTLDVVATFVAGCY